MTTIPEEAVKAALDTWLDHEFDGTLNYPRMRNALTAALPHLPQGVGVKKLEWRQEENGDYIADSVIGWYHIGLPHRMWNLTKPNGEVPSFWMLEDAKDAAQADYSARILSAREPSAARELALEERLQAIEKQLVVNLGYFHDEKRILLETLQSHIISHIAAIRALSSPDHADAGKVEGDGIERGKFYHHQWPMEKLLEARRDGLVDHSGGEAWRYEYSHKDEHGKYDVLYRPVKNSAIPVRLPSAPSQEVAGS